MKLRIFYAQMQLKVRFYFLWQQFWFPWEIREKIPDCHSSCKKWLKSKVFSSVHEIVVVSLDNNRKTKGKMTTRNEWNSSIISLFISRQHCLRVKIQLPGDPQRKMRCLRKKWPRVAVLRLVMYTISNMSLDFLLKLK